VNELPIVVAIELLPVQVVVLMLPDVVADGQSVELLVELVVPDIVANELLAGHVVPVVVAIE